MSDHIPHSAVEVVRYTFAGAESTRGTAVPCDWGTRATGRSWLLTKQISYR
jgi:hypothetical protein